ncbi:hypothetical protein AXF42_Ash018084 [Apostasia shenzhenica]|uniref:Uncharacterized protein n=1 Tax=Apostasia shenzhenica TaxID=1088818 RepID=A0A2I0AVQ2_9ASPA|nr:hypothetical protein AXF42_Ash018084 [Apostasia shenzhenica]
MTSAVNPTLSPRSSRAIGNLSSPWSHVVRGEQESSAGAGAGAGAGVVTPSSPSATPIPSPELSCRSPRKHSTDSTQLPLYCGDPVHGGDGNVADAASTNQGKKPVWNVPSNGSIEGGSIIDTMSWPALSEAARASPKSSSSDSLPILSDGSMSAQPQAFVASSPSPKHGSSNQKPNSGQSTQSSARHKTMKRGSPNGGQALPSLMPITTEAYQSMPDKQPSPLSSTQGLPNRNNSDNNSWDHGAKAGGSSSQAHGGNDHQRGYNGGRKGSSGHHNNNRRDPERGGYEWSHRNFSRDAHIQPPHQQRGVRPYLRPPPVAAAPFIVPPPPLSPFANHMGFPGISAVWSFSTKVEYTMSFLGFAPAHDIAPQQRMSASAEVSRPIGSSSSIIGHSIKAIQSLYRLTNLIDHMGDRIRKRNDWGSWLLPYANPIGSAPTIQSPTTAAYDALAAQVANVVLEDSHNSNRIRISGHDEIALARSASGNLNYQSTDSDRSSNVRNPTRIDTM